MEAAHPNAAESVSNICRQGPISETVVLTVAKARGIDPLKLEPLYEAIDPDALDKLANQPAQLVTIRFTFAGCDVTVHCDGEVIARRSPADGLNGSSAATPGLAD